MHSPPPHLAVRHAALSLTLGGGLSAASPGLRGAEQEQICMRVAHRGFPESLALCDHPRIFHIPGTLQSSGQKAAASYCALPGTSVTAHTSTAKQQTRSKRSAGLHLSGREDSCLP